MASETVECPKCDTRFELWESGGYCTNPDCGVKHPQARQQSDNTPTSDGEIECNSCGESLPLGTAFCQYCGAEVENTDEPEPVPPTSCPGCGADVDPDQDFCMECGTELEPVPPESEHAPITESPAGSHSDAQAAANASAKSSEDEPTPVGTGADQPFTGQTTDDADDSSTPGLPQIEIDIEGERFEVYDGDMVGSEFRRAFMNAGGDRDDARYVHREHIEVDVRDGRVYLIDHGENATQVGGTRMDPGDEQQLKDGDTIELGNVVEAEAHIS